MALSSRAFPKAPAGRRACEQEAARRGDGGNSKLVSRPARPEPPRAGCARRAGRSSDSRAQRPAGRLLLAVASQADQTQCCVTAVVPTYRCGAVPDSHRVPCCLRGPGWPAEPAAGNTIS